MTVIRKFLLTAACVSAIVLGGASAVSAANYGGATLTAPSTATTGGTVILSGTGFLPNAPITITIDRDGVVVNGIYTDVSGRLSASVDVSGRLSASVTAPSNAGIYTDGSGRFSVSVTVPSDPGNYTISATDGVNTVSTTVVVSASGGGSALPVTGNSSSLPIAQLGAALLAVGALIVFGVRRSASKNVREDVTV